VIVKVAMLRRKRVAIHEAGHFLIAYMTGLIPLAYTLSSLDAFLKYKTLNVQAGCRFADAEFNEEVRSGKVKSSSLERFSCVALAGVLQYLGSRLQYTHMQHWVSNHVRYSSYCTHDAACTTMGERSMSDGTAFDVHAGRCSCLFEFLHSHAEYIH